MASVLAPCRKAGIPTFGLVASLAAGQALLLFWRLDLYPYWTDEVAFAQIWGEEPLWAFIEGWALDWHPPLYYIILSAWRSIGGSDAEAWTRVPSAAFALATLLLTHRLGWILAGPRVAAAGTALLALSPLVLMYGRVARYYSLTMLAAALSTLAFTRLVAGRGSSLPYVFASTLLLWSESIGALVLVAHLVALLVCPALRPRLRAWARAVAWVALLWAPWICALTRLLGTHAGGARESWIGGAKGLVFRLAYPAWGLVPGEAVLPWNPLALLLLTLLCGVAIAAGRAWTRNPSPRQAVSEAVCVLAPAALVPWAGTAILMWALVPFDPPTATGRILLFSAPAAYLALALALDRAPSPHGARLLAVILCLEAVGVAGYFRGSELHNPSMAVDWRQVVRHIEAMGVRPGPDLVLVASEPAFAWYARGRVPFRDVSSYRDHPRYRSALNLARDRVWVVERERGEIQAMQTASALLDDLRRRGYRVRSAQTWIPEGTISRAVKSWLLDVPVGAHKLRLTELARTGPP